MSLPSSSSSSSSSSISFKVRYGTDLRRFRLSTSNLTYPILLQTLMNAFGVDERIRVMYKDEEGDMVLIGSTRELTAALIPPPTILHLTLSYPTMDDSMIVVNHPITSPTPSTLSVTQDSAPPLQLEKHVTEEKHAVEVVNSDTSTHANSDMKTSTTSTSAVADVETKEAAAADAADAVSVSVSVSVSSPVTPAAPVTPPTVSTTPTVPVTSESNPTSSPNSISIPTTPIDAPSHPPPFHCAASFDLTKSATWSCVSVSPSTSMSSDMQSTSFVAPTPLQMNESVASVPVSAPASTPTATSAPAPAPAPAPAVLDLIPAVLNEVPPTSASTVSVQLPVAEPALSPSTSTSTSTSTSIPTTTPTLTTTTSTSNWFLDTFKTLFTKEKEKPAPVTIPPTTTTSTSTSTSTSTTNAITSPIDDPEEAAIAVALSRSQYLNEEEKKQVKTHVDDKVKIDDKVNVENKNVEEKVVDNHDDKLLEKSEIMSIRAFVGEEDGHEMTSATVTQLLSTVHSAVHADITQLITSSSISTELPLTFTPSDFAFTRDAMLADITRVLQLHHEKCVEHMRQREILRVQAELEAEREREAARVREAEAAGIAMAAAQEAERQRIAEEQAAQQQQQQQQQSLQAAPITVLPETPQEAARRMEEEIRTRMLALEQMGFTDPILNRRLLETNNNNLGECIEWLLTNNAVNLGPIRNGHGHAAVPM